MEKEFEVEHSREFEVLANRGTVSEDFRDANEGFKFLWVEVKRREFHKCVVRQIILKVHLTLFIEVLWNDISQSN